jgi:hypothetical protein
MEVGSEARTVKWHEVIGKLFQALLILVLGIFVLAGLVFGACFLMFS